MGVASPVRYQAASDRQYAKKLTGVGQTPVERGLNETGSTPPNRGGSDPRSDRDDKDLLKKKKKIRQHNHFLHTSTRYILYFSLTSRRRQNGTGRLRGRALLRRGILPRDLRKKQSASLLSMHPLNATSTGSKSQSLTQTTPKGDVVGSSGGPY